MNSRLSRGLRAPLFVALILVAICTGPGCDGRKGQEAPRPQTPTGLDRSASFLEAGFLEAGFLETDFLKARDGVLKAHKTSFDAAFREVDGRLRALRAGDGLVKPEYEAVPLTLFFTTNLHGEAGPTGSSNNLRGGVARHHRIVAEIEAKSQGPVFHVDAGDLFFPVPTFDRHPPEEIEQGRRKARDLLAAMNLRPPDGAVVGELDLVLGLDEVKELAGEAKFPLLSANLLGRDGARPFPGHVVVERQGKRVAFIGLTRGRSAVEDYFAARGLEVEDGFSAYRREVSAIGAVDAVVLLSNEGLDSTRALVERIREADLPIHAALVSNSNRLTQGASWAAGIPVVEALSAGAYVGRVALYLKEESRSGPSYGNAFTDPGEAILAYRRAYASYVRARQERDEARVSLLAIMEESERAGSEPGEGADEKHGAASQGEFLARQVASLDARVDATARGYLEALSVIDEWEAMLQFGGGDDWAMVELVAVDETIEEDARVRALLERAQIRNP